MGLGVGLTLCAFALTGAGCRTTSGDEVRPLLPAAERAVTVDDPLRFAEGLRMQAQAHTPSPQQVLDVFLAGDAALEESGPAGDGSFAPGPLEGHPDRLSVAQGERIGFAVSTTHPTYAIDFLRIGAGETHVGQVTGLPGGTQPIPPEAWAVGAGWATSYEHDVPSDWKSGLYVARLRAGPRAEPDLFDIPFIVREDEPGSTTSIISLRPDCTITAYNAWGGASLYASAYGPREPIVSWARPIDPTSPAGQWYPHLIDWFDQAGYGVEYASDVDLHLDPGLLDPYRLLVLFGHHEYWSRSMRDAVDAFIGNGGAVFVMAGNSCYWQVRFEDGDNAIRCHKQPTSDPLFDSTDAEERALVTTLWAGPPVLDPPDRTLGLGWRNAGWSTLLTNFCHEYIYGGITACYKYADRYGYYRVLQPEHPLFAGLGLQGGDLFGIKHATVDVGGTSVSGWMTIVGGEVDGAHMELVDGRRSPNTTAGVPGNLMVLADAPARDGFTAISSHHDFGTVLNAGSMQWPIFFDLPVPFEDGEVATANVLELLSTPSDNLAEHAGFERWEDDLPVGWQVVGDVEHSTDAVSGRAALRLPAGGASRVEQTIGPLVAGERYHLLVHDTTSGVGTAQLRLSVAGTAQTVAKTPLRDGPGGYATASGTVPSGANVDGLLEIRSNGGGALTVDNVEVIAGSAWDARLLPNLVLDTSPASDGTVVARFGATPGGERLLVMGTAAASTPGRLLFVNELTGNVAGALELDSARAKDFSFEARDTDGGSLATFALRVDIEGGGQVTLNAASVLPLRAPSPLRASLPLGGAFEHDLEAWTKDGLGGAKLLGDDPAAGDSSLQLDSRRGDVVLWQELTDLAPGPYLLSTWLRSTSPTGSEVRVESLHDGDVLASLRPTGLFGWETTSAEFELTPQDAQAGLRVAISLVNGEPKLRVDALRLRSRRDMLIHDLLSQGTFEAAPLPAELAAGNDWRQVPPHFGVAELGLVTLDDTWAYAGQRSLRIDNPSATARQAYTLVSEPLPVDVPLRVRARVWAGPGAKLRMSLGAARFGAAALTELGDARSDGFETWETVEFVVPVGVLAAVDAAGEPLQSWLFFDVHSGSVWIDDVTVEPER